MIIKMNQFVAYICPTCTAVSGKRINIFDFSGKKEMELHCGERECGEKIATIVPKKGKYKIIVECSFCGYTHEFSTQKSIFWNTDYFAAKCPISDMSIFFWGNEKKISEQIKKQEQDLAELTEEFDSDEEISIMLDIVSLITDLIKEDAVSCQCSSTNVFMQLEDGNIILGCRDCQTSMLLKPTQEQFDRINRADKLIITE